MKTTSKKKLAKLEQLYQKDLRASETGKSRKLNSFSHGEVEVWNYIECQRQNAEIDGNDLLAHFECGLASESDDVCKFFLAHGFQF